MKRQSITCLNNTLLGIGVLTGLLAVTSESSASHGTLTFTQGVYRVPYADGTTVTITFDHHDHGGPNGNKNRVDMVGDVPASSVVAAAGGWIRAIVDNHGNDNGLGDGVDTGGAAQNDALEHSCSDAQDMNGNAIPNSVVTGLCQDYNNYVWIEHPNGEWSKYSHMATGSVTGNGWAINDWINAGEILGPESDVGRAGGPHLHWEVALPTDPTDPTPFSTNGGFIQGTNIVAVVCDIPNNIYATGDSYVTAPCVNQPPVADAGGPYMVDEGDAVVLNGMGSSDPDGTPLVYLWTPADDLDDPSLAQPMFFGVDDADDLPYVLTVFDQTEAVPAMDIADVTVLNVIPTVSVTGDSSDEGQTATVTATFTDPGVEDTHTATIDWGDGNGAQAVTLNALANGVDHIYGDNGDYNVTVEILDDDGGLGVDSAPVTVANLAPTLSLESSEPVDFPGGSYEIINAGDSLPATATGSDAGSDDLTFTWSTGAVNVYFNDGVSADPAMSPDGVFPFETEDSGELIGTEPGVTVLGVTLTDDDGGEATAEGAILVLGTATSTNNGGWWKHQFSGSGQPHIDPLLSEAYREIVNAVSSVFSEAISADSNAAVHLVLSPKESDRRARAASELMQAWLSFASGAVSHNAPVSLNGGGSIGFLDLMANAEALILNPGATAQQLLAVEQDLARVYFAAQ